MKTFGNSVFAFSVFKNKAVVAVNNVDIIVENEILLKPIALMSIQINNHNLSYSLSRLKIMDHQ